VKFVPCAIPDLLLVEFDVFADSRGYFIESYNQKRFHELGLTAQFVQDNISSSTQGTLRGLHYQLNPHAQGKLVRVTQGKVFDVAVDIRKGSPYYSRWVGVELSEENKQALYIPPGFAHGFYVLSERAQFMYKCTDLYVPAVDRGIIWNDPAIGIEWPISGEIVLSEKDKVRPRLADAENNFSFTG
jgi:dTDP-4-dehydrorhamnose 3,5-epimerase